MNAYERIYKQVGLKSRRLKLLHDIHSNVLIDKTDGERPIEKTWDVLHGFIERDNKDKKFNLYTKLNEYYSEIHKKSLDWYFSECIEGLTKDGYRYYGRQKPLKLEILLIDNNIKPFTETLEWLIKVFNYDIFVLEERDEIKKFFLYLKKGEKAQQKEKENKRKFKVRSLGPNKESKKKSLDKFDLILLDLHLGEERRLDGQEILKNLLITNPELPVFIISAITDASVVQDNLVQGADGYIPKKKLITLPLVINSYFEELGFLVWYIREENRSLRRNLIGNLRKWRFNKRILWFGDKCYHMIDHSFNHVSNNWNIANEILPPILVQSRDKLKICDEDLYALCMAVWLHDIGHKGNERCGEPHLIRDSHGLISAEIILRHPEHYGIHGYCDTDSSPYRWQSFKNKSAPQLIRDRIKTLKAASELIKSCNNFEDVQADEGLQKMTILEKTALFCIYHQSNFPIDEEEKKELVRKGKVIPLGCYEEYSRSTIPIYLKSISGLLKDENVMRLLSIFRFIDALDINRNRVGGQIEEKIKLKTIDRDLEFQFEKLREDIETLKDTFLKNSEKGKRFVNLFYDQVKHQIEKEQKIDKDLLENQQSFLDNLPVEIPVESCRMRIDYIEFISISPMHFVLHNAIKNLEIGPRAPAEDGMGISFVLKYKSNQSKKFLTDPKKGVRDKNHKKTRKIRDHLLGEPDDKDKKKRKNDGYARREIDSGKKYLRELFDTVNTKIHLVDKNDDPMEELPKNNDPES